MKNTFLIILAILFIVICITCVILINWQTEKEEVQKYNKQYEEYINKEIYGTDVASLINKAINQNEKNNIEKDEKGYYIDNKQNSIKIDLKMTTIDKTYPMEEIYNNQTTKFVQNFNLVKFKCVSIEYHENTGIISRLVFEELQ
ncbi:MAG: hypothetical protein IJE59_04890 [Clostridia bacterium]|nr:hypothetical protein [Clostridia bacterium]